MTQTIVNYGTAGSLLNGQNGSSATADSNDARYLDHTGTNYVYLPGVAGNFLSVPDEAALDITGDIDLRWYGALDDWTPAASTALISKAGAGGTRAYMFSVNTDGTLEAYWSVAGTTAITRNSTVAPTVTDGNPIWVRYTLDVDNGASGHDVNFYTSNDGTNWTQLGTTVTTAGTTSIFSSSIAVRVGANGAGAALLAGKPYRAQIFDGIDGTKVLDVDTSVITTGAATSFTAVTGQTVTIARSTSGRKSVAVTQPVWLFGTDDYFEVPDDDLIDFGASDSLTVLAVIRPWATQTSNGVYVNKRNTAGGAGYSLTARQTSIRPQVLVADTSASVSTFPSAIQTAGNLQVYGLLANRSTNILSPIMSGVIQAGSSISSIGSLSNALVLRIGRTAAGSALYQDFELIAVAVFRRALTATEIAAITTYYQARWP